MSRTMPFIGMAVSGLVVILFLADLAAGFPFQRVTIPGDIGFIVAGTLLAYMSWSILERSRR